MSIYFVQRILGSKVEEIRRTAKISGVLRFIIDRKGSVKFVTQQEFLSVPAGYKMTKIK